MAAYPGERALIDVYYSVFDDEDEDIESFRGNLGLVLPGNDVILIKIPNVDLEVSEEEDDNIDFYKVGDLYIQVDKESHSLFLDGTWGSLTLYCKDEQAFRRLNEAMDDMGEDTGELTQRRNEELEPALGTQRVARDENPLPPAPAPPAAPAEEEDPQGGKRKKRRRTRRKKKTTF